MAQSASATNGATDFRFSRTFNAPRTDVWNAFTRPEHLKHWWGTPGSSLEIVRFELKVGALFHYRMKLPDGRAMWARFVFREIVAPERLVWINGFSDEHGGLTPNPWVPDAPLETLNTVTLAEQDGKTLLTVTVVPFGASADQALTFVQGINGMKMGFGKSFDALANYLEQSLTVAVQPGTFDQRSHPPSRPDAIKPKGADTEERKVMQIVNKLMMVKMAVTDMPESKAFYADKLGLKITSDYRRDDHNWWVSLALPEAGAAITLTTAHENMKPGTASLYFTTADVAASAKELGTKGVPVSEVKDDLFGPGSGVKWLDVQDPDCNHILLVEG